MLTTIRSSINNSDQIHLSLYCIKSGKEMKANLIRMGKGIENVVHMGTILIWYYLFLKQFTYYSCFFKIKPLISYFNFFGSIIIFSFLLTFFY